MTPDEPTDRVVLMETASLWFARLDSGTADIDAFETWRDADPRHAAAFARIAGVGFQLDRLKKLSPPAVQKTERTRPSRRAVFGAAAVGMAGLSAVAATLSLAVSKVKASTRIGESQSVRLPDGGQISLNTDSRASWKFNNSQGKIWLERGEIALIVPDDSRPCFLYGGDSVVRIANGILNARLREKSLDVTVVEGVCSVAATTSNAVGSASRFGTALKAGQAALIQAEKVHIRSVDAADLHFVSGWRDGELVFNGQTLGAAISEYNRYLPNKIVILDASLEDIRLGGRFKTRDPADFLAALNSGFGIHVARDESGTIMLSK